MHGGDLLASEADFQVGHSRKGILQRDTISALLGLREERLRKRDWRGRENGREKMGERENGGERKWGRD